AQPQLQNFCTSSGDGDLVVSRGLRATAIGIHSLPLAVDDVIIDAIFHIGRGVWNLEDPLVVRLVLREQQRDVPIAVEVALAELGVKRRESALALLSQTGFRGRDSTPRPRVAEPEGRQDVQRGRCRTAVADREADQQFSGELLGDSTYTSK